MSRVCADDVVASPVSPNCEHRSVIFLPLHSFHLLLLVAWKMRTSRDEKGDEDEDEDGERKNERERKNTRQTKYHKELPCYVKFDLTFAQSFGQFVGSNLTHLHCCFNVWVDVMMKWHDW